MPAGMWTVALGLAMQVGQPAPSETPNYPALQNAYTHYGHEGQYEQRYPFDTQQNWVHGYFQEIPAYGGHAFFRPYNYKDVLSQSQTSAGWGSSPVLPYSQQFWHRYHDQATMLRLSQTPARAPVNPYATLPLPPQTQPVLPAGNWSPAPVTQGVLPQGAIYPPQGGVYQPQGAVFLPQGYAPVQGAYVAPPSYPIAPVMPASGMPVITGPALVP